MRSLLHLTTTALDASVCGGRCSTARQCINLSASSNLAAVLAIYPHEPLPDLAFHAPILPHYPTSSSCGSGGSGGDSCVCDVEELVTLGCHQGALFAPNLSVFEQRNSATTPIACSPLLLASNLSFLRIREWLIEHGCRLPDGLTPGMPAFASADAE